MNERIRELAQQAGINCVVPTAGTLEYVGKGEVDHLEKFAELIVRECSKVNDQFIGRRIGEIDLDLVYKEHFGVEL